MAPTNRQNIPFSNPSTNVFSTVTSTPPVTGTAPIANIILHISKRQSFGKIDGGSFSSENGALASISQPPFLDWMEHINQKAQFYFHLEQDQDTTVENIRHLFSITFRLIVQFLIKTFISKNGAWTILHQENEIYSPLVISYLHSGIEVRICIFGKRKQNGKSSLGNISTNSQKWNPKKKYKRGSQKVQLLWLSKDFGHWRQFFEGSFTASWKLPATFCAFFAHTFFISLLAWHIFALFWLFTNFFSIK